MPPKRPATRSTPQSEGESSGAQSDVIIESLRQSNEALLKQMADMQSQIQSLLAARLEQQPALQDPVVDEVVPVPPAPLVPPVFLPPEMNFISHFQRLNPPTYDGRADFMALDDWIIAIEEMFSYSGILEAQKVMIAAYQLKGLAKSWWIREKESLAGGCSWESFKKMLLKKFLPSVEQDRLMNNFLYLKQRQLTVSEYEIEFSKLSRFAPDMVASEEGRVKRFLGGLRHDVQQLACAYKAESYAEAVEAALKVEAIENAKNRGAAIRKEKRKVEDDGSVKASGPASKKKGGGACSFCGKSGHSYEKCFKRIGAQKQQRVLAIQGAPKGELVCSICAKRGHDSSRCWSKDRVCYQCGQKGHVKTVCPQAPPPLQPAPLRALPPPHYQDKGKGKLNVVTKEEAQTSTQVISG